MQQKLKVPATQMEDPLKVQLNQAAVHFRHYATLLVMFVQQLPWLVELSCASLAPSCEMECISPHYPQKIVGIEGRRSNNVRNQVGSYDNY